MVQQVKVVSALHSIRGLDVFFFKFQVKQMIQMQTACALNKTKKRTLALWQLWEDNPLWIWLCEPFRQQITIPKSFSCTASLLLTETGTCGKHGTFLSLGKKKYCGKISEFLITLCAAHSFPCDRTTLNHSVRSHNRPFVRCLRRLITRGRSIMWVVLYYQGDTLQLNNMLLLWTERLTG